MTTTLTFDFNVKDETNHGKFVIDNMRIDTEEDSLAIDYDNIQLFINDAIYTGGIHSFCENNVSASTMFDSVLNAYLRNDTESYSNFNENWSLFSKFESYKEYRDDLLIKFPVYNYSLKVYELQLATPKHKYYNYEDYFLMLDVNNKVVTDIEAFYLSAIGEDIANILQDKERCLYMSDDCKRWIDSEGKDYFITEFGE